MARSRQASLFQPHTSAALAALWANAVVLPLPAGFETSSNLVSLPAEQGVTDEVLRRLLRAVRRGMLELAQRPSDTGTFGQSGIAFGRQAFVGLSNSWGEVTLGRQLGSLYSELEESPAQRICQKNAFQV